MTSASLLRAKRHNQVGSQWPGRERDVLRRLERYYARPRTDSNARPQSRRGKRSRRKGPAAAALRFLSGQGAASQPVCGAWGDPAARRETPERDKESPLAPGLPGQPQPDWRFRCLLACDRRAGLDRGESAGENADRYRDSRRRRTIEHFSREVIMFMPGPFSIRSERRGHIHRLTPVGELDSPPLPFCATSSTRSSAMATPR